MATKSLRNAHGDTYEKGCLGIIFNNFLLAKYTCFDIRIASYERRVGILANNNIATTHLCCGNIIVEQLEVQVGEVHMMWRKWEMLLLEEFVVTRIFILERNTLSLIINLRM